MFLRISIPILLSLCLAPFAFGVPRIMGGGAVNAASRLVPGMPDYGVAKGALFYLRGDELGPAEMVRADFPLPSDGLGGTRVAVTVGGTTVNALMVAVSARQVWAILPSSTPVGAGNVRLTANGVQATDVPIQVVDAAFGIFLQASGSFGNALAFNGGSQLNQLVKTATNGQEVTLIGTGLGAISGDEANQVAVQDLSTDVKVFVGGREAALVSRGRLGLNEMANADSLRFPRGLAALDQITFRVPDGVKGCAVPVSVQVGARFSNYANLAVGDGGTCADLAALGDLTALFGAEGLKTGSVSLIRTNISIEAGPFSLTSKLDIGSASFSKAAYSGVPASAVQFSPVSQDNCMVLVGQLFDTDGTPGDTDVVEDIGLDAGESLRVQGPKGTRQLKKVSLGNYSDQLGMGTSGLPPGLPGLPGGGQPEFLEPGEYTVDNGSGGADIPAFQIKTQVGAPLTWTNQAAVTAVTRTQDLRLNWSGGAAGSQVMIFGFSSTRSTEASFICIAAASAGQFTVPSQVLGRLPATAGGGGPAGETGGGIFLANVTATRVEIPGTDVSVFSTGVMTGKTLPYR